VYAPRIWENGHACYLSNTHCAPLFSLCRGVELFDRTACPLINISRLLLASCRNHGGLILPYVTGVELCTPAHHSLFSCARLCACLSAWAPHCSAPHPASHATCIPVPHHCLPPLLPLPACAYRASSAPLPPSRACLLCLPHLLWGCCAPHLLCASSSLLAACMEEGGHSCTLLFAAAALPASPAAHAPPACLRLLLRACATLRALMLPPSLCCASCASRLCCLLHCLLIPLSLCALFCALSFLPASHCLHWALLPASPAALSRLPPLGGGRLTPALPQACAVGGRAGGGCSAAPRGEENHCASFAYIYLAPACSHMRTLPYHGQTLSHRLLSLFSLISSRALFSPHWAYASSRRTSGAYLLAALSLTSPLTFHCCRTASASLELLRLCAASGCCSASLCTRRLICAHNNAPRLIAAAICGRTAPRLSAPPYLYRVGACAALTRIITRHAPSLRYTYARSSRAYLLRCAPLPRPLYTLRCCIIAASHLRAATCASFLLTHIS